VTVDRVDERPAVSPSGAASFVVPAWGRGTLADVLPAVLAGMGGVAGAATS